MSTTVECMSTIDPVSPLLAVPGIRQLCMRFNVLLVMRNTVFHPEGWAAFFVNPRLEGPSRLPFDVSEVERESEAEKACTRISEGEVHINHICKWGENQVPYLLKLFHTDYIVLVQQEAVASE